MQRTPEEHEELKGLDELWESALNRGRAPLPAELLKFVRNFPTIAPYNAALIGIQRPGSRFALTARDWWKRYRRSIRPGANPLVVLKPFGPVKFVYDVSDVDGDPLPKEITDPFASSGPVTEEGFARFVRTLPAAGIAFAQGERAPASAGFIERLRTPRTERIDGTDREIRFHLVINRDYDVNAQFATVAHELGHLYCGHVGELTRHTAKADGNAAQARTVVVKDRSSLEPETRECEAEAVSWLVCGRIGVESPAGDYLGGLLAGASETPPVSLEAILGAVRRVESLGHGAERLGVTLRDDRLTLFSTRADGPSTRTGGPSARSRTRPSTATPAPASASPSLPPARALAG